jgi:S1-C subfamily serine protease
MMPQARQSTGCKSGLNVIPWQRIASPQRPWRGLEGDPMRRSALYSRSTARPVSAPARSEVETGAAAPRSRGLRRWRLPAWNDPRLLWLVIALLTALTSASLLTVLHLMPRALTQKDIDGAVLKTLETVPLPSKAAKAYDAIAPSVVRVTGFDTDKKTGQLTQRSVGTGVVIVNKGIILTNLHVVQGAPVIRIEFADGLQTTASVTGAQPENDLAVLQAHQIPDDLNAATLRSTADLAPGDEVLAVGFPFGIGPSASAGVISGLQRAFRSPEGKQEMRNLIQFDAAANPGNSGGPLVTMDGQVVGIVTAIYNPSEQRTFIGIGFAVPIENAASAIGMPPF